MVVSNSKGWILKYVVKTSSENTGVGVRGVGVRGVGVRVVLMRGVGVRVVGVRGVGVPTPLRRRV